MVAVHIAISSIASPVVMELVLRISNFAEVLTIDALGTLQALLEIVLA